MSLIEEPIETRKWFYSLVVRTHNKSIPFFGVSPVNHDVHHKSHLDKLMVVASFYFLPACQYCQLEHAGYISFALVEYTIFLIQD